MESLNSISLAELHLRAYALIERSKVPENELKAFICEIMEIMTKDFLKHYKDNELLDATIESVSLSGIGHQEED